MIEIDNYWMPSGITGEIKTELVLRESKQTIRSRSTIILALLGTVFSAGMLWSFGIGGPGGSDTQLLVNEIGGETTLAAIQSVTAQFIFLSGLVLGIQAFSSERSSGSLILTASMPHSRFQILLGKILGRSIAVLAITAIPVVMILVAGSIWYGIPGVLRTVVFLLVTSFYAVVCVGIGVSVSAVIRKSAISALIAGSAFLFGLFWETILSRLIYARLTGTDLAIDAEYGGELPEAFLLFQRIAPHVQYNVITNMIIGAPNAATYARIAVSAAQPNNTVISVYVIEQAFNSVPVYLLGEVYIFGLLGWFIGPLWLGYLRFHREVIQ